VVRDTRSPSMNRESERVALNSDKLFHCVGECGGAVFSRHPSGELPGPTAEVGVGLDAADGLCRMIGPPHHLSHAEVLDPTAVPHLVE